MFRSLLLPIIAGVSLVFATYHVISSQKPLPKTSPPGEYIGAPPSQALIVLGDAGPRHVRVDIDEHDIPRFRPDQPAVAKVRGGDDGRAIPLRFVRVEPYVRPKRSLTGDATERVDTRVLQAIYVIENDDRTVFVGQQLDVFIEL